MSSLQLSAPLRFSWSTESVLFAGTKTPASVTEARSSDPRGTTLLGHTRHRRLRARAVCVHSRRCIARHPGAAYWVSLTVLPRGSEASSGTCLHRSCTTRRLSGAQPQLPSSPRQRLTVLNCWAKRYTVTRRLLNPSGHTPPRGVWW